MATTTQVNVRLPRETADWLRAHAAATGLREGQVIDRALRAERDRLTAAERERDHVPNVWGGRA